MKTPFRIIITLALNQQGLSYKELSAKTGYHPTTISRQITFMHNKDLVDIEQIKSNSVRGRKWVNIVKLKKNLLESKTIAEFFSKLIKQLNNQLNSISDN